VDDLFAEHDALAVAELVKQRKIGARELLAATMARLRKLNESLNAVTDCYDGELLERSIATAGEGPFQGVPFVVKQLMAQCAGTTTTLGSKFLARQPAAPADSASARKAAANVRRIQVITRGREITWSRTRAASNP